MAGEWWASDPLVEQPEAGGDQWWNNDPVVGDAPTPTSRGQRFLQGIKDVALGTEQLAAHAAGGLGLSDTWAPAVDKRIGELQSQYVAPEGIDWARMGGNAAAGLPLAVLPGGPVTAGIIGGALGGATAPVENTAEGFWSQKATQAGLGAATGGLGGAALSAAGRVLAPKVSPQVRMLAKEGVTPTPGQILGGAWKANEDKFTSIPFYGDAIIASQKSAIRDFNRAAYARALEPIGGSVEGVGRDAVGAVRDKLSKAYDDLFPKLNFKIDPQFNVEMATITSSAMQNLPEPQAKHFMQILQNKMLGKMETTGELAGKTYQGVDSELRRLADGYKGDASFDQRELGDHINRSLDAVRGALARTNPDHAAELAGIQKGWAQYARIREAASSPGAHDGVFTPAMLDRAVRHADKSAGHGAYAAGRASGQDFTAAGKSALSQSYPDNGTAERAAFNSMFASGVGGAAIVHSPWLAGLLLPTLPYLSGSRKAAAAALLKRPPGAAAARAGMFKAAAPLGFLTAQETQ